MEKLPEESVVTVCEFSRFVAPVPAPEAPAA
jgi:hypothetical protein